MTWAAEAFFYHIYPLGLCGAPARNDLTSPPVPRLEQLHGWLDHLQALGVTAVYLGPLFESTAHGYDTADYYHLDRRLGDRGTLRALSASLHQGGLRLVLDGVFNHVGRDFWAFRDLLSNGAASPYRDWFTGLDFTRRSPYNDPFHYEGWEGHHDLVKLNLTNPAVKEHLFQAIEMWVNEAGIDGLRLDVAYCLDPAFLTELSAFCRRLRLDFFLLGEVVHGDYRRWANPAMLDSVTNYECYKGLYSSHNDANYFEIAYALNRQFGEGGLYCGLPLYNFADNHDVNRVASSLKNTAHLFPLYALLFTMPGVPSVYYGSEFGLSGTRTANDDRQLRPALALSSLQSAPPQPGLPAWIQRLAGIRRSSNALRHGAYRQLHVSAQQLAFARQAGDDLAVVLLNAADHSAAVPIQIPGAPNLRLRDLLDPKNTLQLQNGATMVSMPPNGARILVTG